VRSENFTKKSVVKTQSKQKSCGTICYNCANWYTKRGKMKFVASVVYLLLSSNASTIPTIAIAATIMPIPGIKYWSAIDAGGAVGASVGSGASITVKELSAYDGQ
jgi:hypothetical protein